MSNSNVQRALEFAHGGLPEAYLTILADEVIRLREAVPLLERVRSEFSSRSYSDFRSIQGKVEEFLESLEGCET